jgi:hypothetical protein
MRPHEFRVLNDVLALLKEQQQQIWELQDQVEYLTDKLKEQKKKQITLHKKHVITWGRNDEFSMGKLYEAICETLLDEGELFIARTDDHEKVDFVFYVTKGR